LLFAKSNVTLVQQVGHNASALSSLGGYMNATETLKNLKNLTVTAAHAAGLAAYAAGRLKFDLEVLGFNPEQMEAAFRGFYYMWVVQSGGLDDSEMLGVSA
jgi:hypothetical protein